MNNLAYVFPLSLVIRLSIVSISESAIYSTIQLTNNNYWDHDPCQCNRFDLVNQD